MIRAFSISPGGDRGRLRGWLRGSLAGLCELQLLRERQELRVRRALRAGETTDEDEEEAALEAAEQMDSLPELMWELEQQVGGLRLDGGGTCGDMAETDSWPSSGFHEPTSPGIPPDSPASFCGNGFPSFQSVPEAFPRSDHTEARMHYASERPKSAGDIGLGGASPCRGGRGMVPRSYSAPYSSSQDYSADSHARYHADRRSREVDPFLFPSPLHAVSLQNPTVCQSQLRSRHYEDAPYPGYAGKAASGMDLYVASPEDYQPFPETTHWRKVENYMLSLVHRRGPLVRASKPRTSLNAEPGKGVARQNSLCKRPSEPERKPQSSPGVSPCGYESSAMPNKGWPPWDCSVEGENSQPSNLCNPPHSSLRKPPKLQVASAHPRSLSMDHYERNYAPASNSNYPDALRFEASPHEGGTVTPPPAFRTGSPRQPTPDSDFQGPQYEGGDGFEKRPAQAEDSGCQMVNAQYIPAQMVPRPQPSHRPPKKKPPPLCKVRSVELSPERCPGRTRGSALKKCRFPEEGGDASKHAARKGSPRSKKAPRSQSENSLLNKQASIERTVTKYHTVDREEVALSRGSRQRRPPVGAYRKWRSTAEICQDEIPPSDPYRVPKRSKKSSKGPLMPPLPRPASPSTRHVLYGYTGSDSEYSAERLPVQRAPVCEPEDDLSGYAGNCYGESESSLSEAESPGSSDTDESDSDESGGLVWPQQLSPRVVSSTGAGNNGGQPKVFVKIKASHALKKKILRFRTGSLKVMTTV
ncbi:dapper homolog 3 [Ambystoma mexicanum]|uniref:dapper homolog 3 n=1 Tax=Ambystoma mexicanum TaxID=8296 RepID=UPI0037E865A5